MEWHWYLLIFIWYLSGSLGGLKIAKLINDKINTLDYFTLFTAGGLLGLINVIIGLLYLYEHNKTMKRIKELIEEEKDKYG